MFDKSLHHFKFRPWEQEISKNIIQAERFAKEAEEARLNPGMTMEEWADQNAL
jgi:hypothetical protein